MMRIRLTDRQLQGIFATGAAASATSATVQAPAADVAARVETLLAEASGANVSRVDETTFYADRSGPILREGWQARLATFGPKTTVDLRAARVVKPWVVLVMWFFVTPAIGVGAALLPFSFTQRPPGFLPGVGFVVGLSLAVYAIMAGARGVANRWTTSAHQTLLGIERSLTAAKPSATYREV